MSGIYLIDSETWRIFYTLTELVSIRTGFQKQSNIFSLGKENLDWSNCPIPSKYDSSEQDYFGRLTVPCVLVIS